MDKAICSHLVAVFLTERIDYPNLQPLIRKKTFKARFRRHAPKRVVESSFEEETEDPSSLPATVEYAQPSPPPVAPVADPRVQKITSLETRRSNRIVVFLFTNVLFSFIYLIIFLIIKIVKAAQSIPLPSQYISRNNGSARHLTSGKFFARRQVTFICYVVMFVML